MMIPRVNITVFWKLTPCSLTDVYNFTEERTAEIFNAEEKVDHGETRHRHRRR
jgi:hypothetical protein